MRVLTFCLCTLLMFGSLAAQPAHPAQPAQSARPAPPPAQSAHPTQPADSSSTSSTGDPVQRFLSRPPEHLTSYRALRTLRAANKRFKKEGWMTAWTELDPRAGFRYEIVGEGGSDYIRRKVLRKMLDGERDAITSGQPARVALSLANYRISVMSDDGQIAKLQIVPLRADTLLVNGTVTIEAGTGDLLSVDGRLAKNPSFWTNRVDVSRRYGRIAGVRVPLRVESTASVKIAGTSEFSMTYDYASINGLPVGDLISDRALPPHHRYR